MGLGDGDDRRRAEKRRYWVDQNSWVAFGLLFYFFLIGLGEFV